MRPYRIGEFGDEDAPLMTHGMPVMEPVMARRGAVAASLEAAGSMSLSEIARAAGLHRQELEVLRRNDWYKAIVRNVLDSAVMESGAMALASRAGRLAKMQYRYDKLERIIEERAAAAGLGDDADADDPMIQFVNPDALGVPGAGTGLLTHEIRQVGAGLNARIVHDFKTDTGLLSAMMDIEKAAAKELGQTSEKNVSVTLKRYVGVDLEAL